MPTAAVIKLSATERPQLKRLARSQATPHRLVIRARILRMAAAGKSNAGIAARLGLKVDTVRMWRDRFAVLPLAEIPQSRTRRSRALRRPDGTCSLWRWRCPPGRAPHG